VPRGTARPIRGPISVSARTALGLATSVSSGVSSGRGPRRGPRGRHRRRPRSGPPASPAVRRRRRPSEIPSPRLRAGSARRSAWRERPFQSGPGAEGPGGVARSGIGPSSSPRARRRDGRAAADREGRNRGPRPPPDRSSGTSRSRWTSDGRPSTWPLPVGACRSGDSARSWADRSCTGERCLLAGVGSARAAVAPTS
jgi:hypothetical protein